MNSVEQQHKNSYTETRQFKAILKALKNNITFAAFLMPGESLSKIQVLIDLNSSETISDRTLAISPWDTDYDDRIIVRDTISTDDFLRKDTITCNSVKPEMFPCCRTTDELLYKGQVLSIVTDLKENRPSKTVLSRVVCGILDNEDPDTVRLNIIHDYFSQLKNTFRFVYFTPTTGCWLGASPEILLNVNKTTGRAETVALAGTRNTFDNNNEWDSKNTNEQGLVVKFIKELLHHFNIKYDVTIADDVIFGHIKHKCEHFSFNIHPNDIYSLIDNLSPTPALSGYPRSKAMDHINRIELHNRYCYGGYVAVENTESIKAYVNLRCVHFYKDRYCIYTGSGITEDSKADDEWTETEKKISLLHSIILNN